MGYIWLFSEGAGGFVVGLPNPGHKEWERWPNKMLLRCVW